MFILHDFCLCQLLNMLFRIVEKSTNVSSFLYFLKPSGLEKKHASLIRQLALRPAVGSS